MKKNKRFLAVLLSICFFFSSFARLGPVVYAAPLTVARTVAGNISLPDGEVATQDINIEITATNDNGTPDNWGDDISINTQCFIPYNQNSATYSINIPNGTLASEFKIRYRILMNTSYLQEGYYNIGGTVARQTDASMVDLNSGDGVDINLAILRGYLLSGTVSRPVGASTEAPVTVEIIATDEGQIPYSGSDNLYYGKNITIPVGEMTTNYELLVAAGNYNVRYNINQMLEGYTKEGYYNDNGTTPTRNSATNITVTDTNVAGKNITLITGKSISGTISLPTGDVAPAGGLQVNVNAWSDNGTQDGFDDFNTGIGVTIPEGENSVNYSITVPDNIQLPAFKIGYRIFTNTNYLQQGNYSTNGTGVRQNDYSMVDVSTDNRADINLAILRGYMISGTVSRPAEASTEIPITLEIIATDEGADLNNGYDNLTFEKSVTIPAGAMTSDYELAVATGNYKLRYYINQMIEGYTNEGYYSDNGTTNRGNASSISVTDFNVAGKNITLITGKSISGIISLPTGDTAPAGGLRVDISARSDNGTEDGFDDYSTGTGVTIPEGENSVNYSITVPDNISLSAFRVGYRIFANTSYLQEGYYSTNGTVPRQNDYSMVDVSTDNRADINLAILRGYMISGTVSRPSGASTEVPITMEISATDEGTDPNYGNDDLNYWNSITIPVGAMSANYELAVATGNYKLRYYLNEMVEGYTNEGYYSDNGTTIRGNASIISVTDNNVTENNITLITGKSISGIISLPTGDTAPTGGLRVYVNVWSDNGTDDGFDDYSTGIGVTIPEGENSVNYSITVPDNISSPVFRVEYRINADSSYLPEGYYSANGTVAQRNDANMVDISSGNSTNNNLEILNGYKIFGTVSRPANASTEVPISVEISATDEGTDINNGNDDLSYWNSITIPAGAMSADYEMVVASGNYKVRYSMNQTIESYLREGYFSANGTTPLRESASVISVTENSVNGNNVTLISGSPISGTISLPSGDTAPAGGLRLNVNVWSNGGTDTGVDDFNTGLEVTIPEGANSVNYSLIILKGETRSYRLNVNPPSNSIYTSPDETQFTATDGIYTSPINQVLNKSQLSGQIVGPGNETIPYGYVQIKEENGDWIPGVSSDQVGKFTIGGLSDGEYVLHATKWDSDFTSSIEVKITISQGKYIPTPENDPLTLRLTSPQIIGTVYSKADVPANGGNIELCNDNGMWIANSNIGSDGTYAFGGLSAGTYIIKAYPNGENTDYTPSKDQTVVITENETVSQDIMLTVPQIRGTVKDADGNLASQGWVEIHDKYADMGMPGARIIDGNYSIGGLNDGTYVLRARPEPGTQFTASAESEVTITDGTLSSGIVDLEFTKAQLNGTILDPAGNSTEYGWIDISTESGEWITGSSANINGQFSIGGLKDGTYIIRAYPNGGVQFTPSVEEVITITGGIANPASKNIYLTLPQVTGLLVSPDGTTMRRGHIEIRKQNGQWVDSLGVGMDGCFAISGLSDGTYLLKAYPEWNSEYSTSDDIEITIQNGQINEGIVIALNNPQISGTVIDPNGVAGSYGDVEVTSTDGRWVTGSSVNQDGLFSVGSLKDGIYILKAYPDWRMNYCESESVIIEIKNGEYVGSPITLQLTKPLASGTVKDPTGTDNVKYGWIDVKNYATGEWQNGYGVNEFGRFNIGNLADGTYILRAISDRNSPYANSEEMIIKVNNGILYNEENVEITNLEMKLTAPKIIGQVLAPDGISATSFGWVEVRTQDGEWIAGSDVDFYGKFKLGKLGPAGTYIIKAYQDSYGNYTPSLDITVEIDDNGTMISADHDALKNGVLNITLTDVQLKGKVVSAENQLISYGFVEIQKDMGDNRWDSISSVGLDLNGEFKIGGLADGTYRLKAFPDQSNDSDSASINYTITIIDGAVKDCDIPDAFDNVTNTITLMLSVPQLVGKIVGPNNESVAYGWVEVRDQNNNYVTGIGAGNNGGFAISGLEANQTYEIIAYPAQNSEFSKSEAILIKTDGNGIYSNNPVTLQLSSIQLTGVVKEPDGQTANKGWVEIYSNGQWIDSTSVDENGTFKFGGLQDGQYSILAFAEPGTAYANSQIANFEITQGDIVGEVPLDLTLTIPQTTGIVYLPGGITKANSGWVEIGNTNENWLFSVPIGNDGTFNIPAGLENGNYTIQAFPAMGTAYSESDVKAFTIDGNPNTLTLVLK